MADITNDRSRIIYNNEGQAIFGGSNAVIWVNPAAGSHAGVNFRQDGTFKGFVGFNNSSSCVNLSMDGSIADGINVNASHDVMIGTTTSQGALTVVGGTQTVVANLTANSSIGLSVMGMPANNFNAISLGAANSTNNAAVWRFKYNGAGSTNNYLGLGFYANDDILNVKANKNVGIGTTSPEGKLMVETTGADATPLIKLNRERDGGRIQLQYAGNENGYGEIGQMYAGTGRTVIWIGANLNSFATGHSSAPVQDDANYASWFSTWNSYNDQFTVNRISSGSTSQLFTINSSGNVGIGTSSPGNLLDVAGDTDITGQLVVSHNANYVTKFVNTATSMSNNNYTLMVDSSAHTSNMSTAGAMSVDVNSGRAFTITGQGNVGIGTASPNMKLNIHHADQDGLRFNCADGLETFIDFGDASDNDIGRISYDHADNHMAFRVNNAERMHINSSGQVMINATSQFLPAIAGGSAQETMLTITKTQAARTNLVINNQTNSAYAGSALVLAHHGADYILEGQSTARGGAFTIHRSTVELFRISSSGNIGIGTASPQTFLQIGDYPSNNIDITTYPDVPSEHMIHLSAPETTNRYGAGISFGENSFTAANITVQDAGGNGSLHMLFGTRDTSGIVQERMRITSAGNIGIGTTSPGAKLDVGGNARVGNVSSNSSTTNYETKLIVKGKNNYSDGTNWYGDYGQIILDANSNMTGSARKFMITNALNNNKFAIIRSVDATTDPVTDSTASGVNSGTADFVIDNTGRIGIGTTTPGYRLDVTHVGADAINVNASNDFTGIRWSSDQHTYSWRVGSDVFFIYDVVNAAQRVTLDASGKLGIGTTSPSAPLTVAGSGADGTAMLRLEATAGSQTFNWISSILYPNLVVGKTIIKLFGKEQALNNQAYVGFKYAGDNSTSNQLTLGFYGNDFLVNLLANGNLGIGETSPDNKLHVKGGATTRVKIESSGSNTGVLLTENGSDKWSLASASGALLFYSEAASSTRLTINSSGSVGIGLTSPQYDLHVIGTIGTRTLKLGHGNNYARVTTDDASKPLDLQINSVNALRVATNKDIGIGTDSPQSRVHVYNANTFSSIRLQNDNGSGSTANIVLQTDSSGIATDGFGIYDVANAAYNLTLQRFTTGSATSTRMEISPYVSGTKNVEAWLVGVDENHSIKFRVGADNKTYYYSYGGSGTDKGHQFYTGGLVSQQSLRLGISDDRIIALTNVGIGVTSPGHKLDVNGDAKFISNSSSRVLTLLQQSADNGNIIQFQNQSGTNVWELVGRNNQFYIYNNALSAHALFISPSNSNIGIGNTSPSQKLHVTGSILASSDVVAFSDKKLKENIKTLDGSKVYDMRGVSFTRKDTGKNSSGVIAQEIQKIAPELVTDNDGTLSVAYGNLTGYLIEAVKELKTEVEQLKKQIKNGNNV